MMHKSKFILLAIVLHLIPMESLNVGFVSSVKAAETTKKKTRKTPALREKVYSQLSRAQKLADDGKVNEGLDVLKQLEGRSATMNRYEKAMMWNFYGFIYYAEEDIANAVNSFSKVVKIENIPEALEMSTLFSLAQLSLQLEKYSQAIGYIDQWTQLKGGKVDGKAAVLKANAYYAMKQYENSLTSINNAIASVEAKQQLPKENWLVLKRALHYELKQKKAVTQVSEQLVRLYAKPQYWIELANMYGETEQTDKQLAILEAAHQQGFVTRGSDIQTLAQLYFFSGAPFKAANLLEKELENGKVKSDLKTLQFLAQAWTSAKESEKAIPVLKNAAKVSSDGNMDARLAEVYINLEQWENAIDAGESARKKGQLKSPGNLGIAMGMAYFNLKYYAKSIVEFQSAKAEKSVKQMATQWLEFVEKEKEKDERLNQTVAALGS